MPTDDSIQKRLGAIERRLDRIENRLGLSSNEERIAQVSATHQTAKTQTKETPTDPNIGFKVFGSVGFFLILLALFYLYRWAVEHNLLTIPLRVGAGVLFSLGIVWLGDVFSRKGNALYGRLLMGGGCSLLYFTIFATYHFPTYRTTLGMPLWLNVSLLCLVAIISSLLAIREKSAYLAGFTLSVGFMGILFGAGSIEAVIAALILSLFAIALMDRTGWPIAAVPIIGSYLALFVYIITNSYPAGPSFIFLAVLFLLFLFGSLRVKNEDQALILGGGNAALSFIVLLVLLSKHAPTWDGLATLVLALFYLTLSFVREDSTRGWGYRLAGLALLIIFVPLQFDRAWITLAWAVLGAALYWTGVQKDWLPIRIAGYTALGLATLKALLWDVSVLHFPDRTIGLLAATVALIATGVVPITALRAKVKHIETAHTLLIVAGTILITITFATEILDGNGLLRMASENARQIILSIIWAAEAVLLLFMGMRDSESALRTTGLILFAITVLKVLFIDVSDIATVYRIIVTLVVGLIALGGAYYYVRNNAKN